MAKREPSELEHLCASYNAWWYGDAGSVQKMLNALTRGERSALVGEVRRLFGLEPSTSVAERIFGCSEAEFREWRACECSIDAGPFIRLVGIRFGSHSAGRLVLHQHLNWEPRKDE